MKISEQYRQLKPYIVDEIRAIVGAGGSGAGGTIIGVVPLHGLADLSKHSGLLAESQAPWAVTSSVFAAHTANANAHHNQAHVLANTTGLGSDHSVSGLTAGQVLRATAATAARFQQLAHGDLSGVTADQHHAQVHSITGTDHTLTGSALQVVGATATNTLGLLTPSANPGAAAAILRTDAAGKLTLVTAEVTGTLYIDDTIDFGVDTMYEDATYLRIAGSKPLNVGNLLIVDNAAAVMGVGVAPDGAATLDVYAKTNADHTVRIKQRASQTGRLWRIEDTGGGELIVLDSQGNLQSGNPGFVSGLTGWQITPAGNAEFNNIWARGEFHASIFVMDEFHSNGGTFVTATAGKLENDAVLSATSDVAVTNCRSTAFAETIISYRHDTGSTQEVGDNSARSIENWIDITDPPSGHAEIFQPGHILRCKTFTGTAVYDLWLRVNSSSDIEDYYRYHVQVMSGTYTTLPAGAAVIRYGKPGDGLILQTSDLQYAPYMDIFTVGDEPWNGDIIPHVRSGRLDGVGVPGVSGIEQYGQILGTDLSDANSPYFVASNLMLHSYRIPSTWNDGTNNTVKIESDGHVLIGTNVDTEAGVAFDFDPLNGVLRVGNQSYGGQILVYGDGGGVTNINGGNIQTGSITGDKVSLSSYLAIGPAVTYGTDGIQLEYNSGNPRAYVGNGTDRYFQFDGTTITFAAANTSLDASGNLTASSANLTGTITANSGYIGTQAAGWVVASGQITSTNIGLYSGAAARVQVGASGDNYAGIYNASAAGDVTFWAGKPNTDRTAAPFRVTAAGALTATDVSITAGTVVLNSSGATISAPSSWNLTYGYKFNYGGIGGGGLTANYQAGSSASLSLWNNTANDGTTEDINNINAFMLVKNVASGTGYADTTISSLHVSGSKVANLTIKATSTTREATFGVDTLKVNTNTVWHAGNDGHTTGLDADTLDTYEASAFAKLNGAAFTGAVSTTTTMAVTGALTAGDVGTSWQGLDTNFFAKKFGDLIILRGYVTPGTGTGAFTAGTLPSGWRPPGNCYMESREASGTTRTVIVASDGTIRPQSHASGVAIYFDSLVFSIS